MTRPDNYKEAYIEMHDLYIATVKQLKDCRNELCHKCGSYREKHLGACEIGRAHV